MRTVVSGFQICGYRPKDILDGVWKGTTNNNGDLQVEFFL
jgi:hypothetical protein